MRRLLLIAPIVSLLVAGCGATDSGDETGLPRGWTELPPAPYTDALVRYQSFWAADRLVVTGGYTTDGQQITFQQSTYEFSLETNTWTEGAPLTLTGFDGALPGNGVWTGSHWVGWMAGCRSGQLIDDLPLNSCQDFPLLVSWSPDGGWNSAQMPQESVDESGSLVAIAGQAGSEAVVATQNGAVFTTGDALDGARFVPWPDDAQPFDPHAACTTDNAIIVVSSSAGQLTDQDLNAPREQQLVAHVLQDARIVREFEVISVPGIPTFPFCQPGVGLYVDGAAFSLPLHVVNADGSRPLALAPTTGTGDLAMPLANVTSLWLDVGDGVVSFDTIGMSSFYMRATDGSTTALQPVPRLGSPTIWTGQVVLAHLHASSRWFVFVPGQWETAGELPPPDI